MELEGAIKMKTKSNSNTIARIIFGLTILLSFMSCAKQHFSTDTDRISSQLSQSGAIVINKGDEFTQSQNVWLSIFADDADSMYITNDSGCHSGGEWTDLRKEYPWVLGEENRLTSVYIKFKTLAGIESGCLNDSIVHDNLKPEVTFSKHPEAYTSNKLGQFSISAHDLGSGIQEIECLSPNQAEYVSCGTSVTTSTSTQGNQVFRVRARDKAGNVSDPVDYTWLVDWTPPSMEWNKTPQALTGENQAEFLFSAQDDLSGISKILCFNPLSQTELECSQGSLKISGLSEGQFTAKIKARDRAGNESEWKNYKWQVDLTAPTIQLTSTPKLFENKLKAIFGFEGTDKIQSVNSYKCRLDKSEYKSCRSGDEFTLPPGSHLFEVVAIDNVGNQSQPAAYNWLIDIQAPTVEWISHPGLYSSDPNPKLFLKPNDLGGSQIDRLDCSLNGSPINCLNNTISPTQLSEGQHRVSVVATDKAGNSSLPLAYFWNVDYTPPQVSFISKPTSPLSTKKEDSFEFIGQDNRSPISGYECQQEGGGYTKCQSPFLLADLNQGLHSFGVRAIDSAGNTSNPISHTWTLDTMGPKIVVLSYPMNHGMGIKDSVHFSISDEYAQVASIECGLMGKLRSCNPEMLDNLGVKPPGVYTYIIKAIDSLGNNSQPVELKWEVKRDVETHRQTRAISDSNGAVDILFVVDNSGSMREEQLEMKNRISGFISKIQNLDWQIAVTSTDALSTAPFGDGKFKPFSTSKYMLTPKDSRPDEVLGQALELGTTGDSNERGINATYRAIERAVTDPSSPQGKFLRKPAALATVLISDEDECSTGCSPDVISSSPVGLIDLVKSKLGNEKRFIFHSIVWQPGSNCPTGYSQGHIYSQLTQMTRGILGNVCSDNYSDQLSGIGQSVGELVKSVQLNCSPVDSNGDGQVELSIFHIASDGSRSEITDSVQPFIVNGDVINFSEYLPAGKYEFEYDCLK